MKFLYIKIVANIFSLISGIQVSGQDNEFQPDSGKIERKALYTTIALEAAYVGSSFLVLEHTKYADQEKVPFHFFNDNKGFLQVDKFAHGFASYVGSYIGYHGLRSAGLDRTKALLLGGTFGFVMLAPFEIMDGIHEYSGFSWGDMLANSSGPALVIGQELLFHEQLVKYKFSYWESSYPDKANGYFGETSFEKLFNDYNGHTYWLSFPVKSLIPKRNLPPWLNVAVGYGANGMYGVFDNISSYNGVEIPETTRYRQYLLSLDIDWTRIPTDSRFLKILFKGMTFIKLPFPAVEYNSLGKVNAYWLYY